MNYIKYLLNIHYTYSFCSSKPCLACALISPCRENFGIYSNVSEKFDTFISPKKKLILSELQTFFPLYFCNYWRICIQQCFITSFFIFFINYVNLIIYNHSQFKTKELFKIFIKYLL